MKVIKQSKERTAEDNRALRDAVTAIIDNVCARGDEALHKYNERFDACKRTCLRVSREEIEEAYDQMTDQELLEKAGGIVQGMSGAPILQNGKCIGAVTHVFVRDVTRGYATFLENML